jgi:hypothetical protein
LVAETVTSQHPHRKSQVGTRRAALPGNGEATNPEHCCKQREKKQKKARQHSLTTGIASSRSFFVTLA